MEDNKKKDHFLLGVFIGIAAGALLGVLYAPNEGKVTRKKLTYKLKKLREKLTQYLHDLKDGKEEHVSMAKSKGEKVVNDAKEKAEKLLQDVESFMAQINKK